MGGEASQMALDSIIRTMQDRDTPNPGSIKSGIEKANIQVYNTALQKGVGRMGTTVTVAYVLGDTMHLGHVGDSRAYLIRQGKAECLTVDHTQVGEMVRARILAPSRIRTHAQRSILTKAVGIGLFITPSFSRHKLVEGDRVILCSDGVWSVIEDDEFARVADHSSVERLSQALVDLAMERESDDNASVVAFQINKFVPDPETQKSHKNPGWVYKLRKMTR